MNASEGAGRVVTVWFVTAAEPLSVLAAEPGPDRGFGRKYLALLDPRLTVSPIGDFPLNRSAPAGPGEFYIGGYDGLAVVQTVLDGVSRLSELPQRYLRGIAATDVYAFSADHRTGFGAFAHWRAGELKRAFAATRVKILEDEGLPGAFEGDFWAGRRPGPAAEPGPDGRGGVALPFSPAELSDAAAAAHLGFDPADPGPDIPVSAFAVDGRRPPAKDPTAHEPVRPPGAQPPPEHASAGMVDYDDYEDHSAEAPNDAARRLRDVGRAAVEGAKSAGDTVAGWGRRAWAQVQKRNRR